MRIKSIDSLLFLTLGIFGAAFLGTSFGETVPLPLGVDPQQIIDSHPEGTEFELKSGVHRGYEITIKAGDTLTAEPGAIFSGAELLTDWKFEDPYWVHEGPHSKVVPDIDDETRIWAQRANYPHDLFFDDVPLVQKMSITYIADDKSWFYDYEADKVYIAFDPVGREMELSGLCRFGLRALGQGVTLRGLRFENYATYDLDPIVYAGPGALVEKCVVSGSHCIGIQISSNSVIRHCAFNYNGLAGLINGGEGTLIEFCEFAYNGWAGFSGDWARGGAKVPGVTNSTLRRNYAHHNTGPGFWFDINSHGNVFEENLSEYNSWEGLIYELSCGCEIRNNILRWNGLVPRGGLLWGVPFVIQNAEDANVHHNYFESSPAVGARGGGASIINQFRPQYSDGFCGEHTTEGNYIHDNVMVMPRGGYNGLQYGSFGWSSYNDFLESGNLWERNTYFSGKPTSGSFHWYGPGEAEEDFVIQFYTWEEWQDKGQDRGSVLQGRHASFFNPRNPELDALILKTTGVSYVELKAPFLSSVPINSTDTDDDGMPDSWEKMHGLDFESGDAELDPDSDGLDNGSEYVASTDPHAPDSDGDGIPDSWEVAFGLEPLVADGHLDPDEDSFSNLEEFERDTDPRVAKSLLLSVPEEGLTMWLKSGAPIKSELLGKVTSWRNWQGGRIQMNVAFNHSPPELSTKTENGYPMFDFSRGDLKSEGGSVFGEDTKGWTLFAVFRMSSINDGLGKSALMGNSIWRESGFRLTLEQGYLHFYSTQAEDPISVSSYRRLIEGEVVVVTLFYDDDKEEGRIYLDSVEQDRSRGCILENTEPLWVGHIGGMNSQSVDYGELLTYERPLGHTDRRAVEAMLTAKYKSTGIGMKDSDGDGMADWWEMEYGGVHDADKDWDLDGLSNFEEFKNRINPLTNDTDGDGLPDSWELLNGWNPRFDDSVIDIDGDDLSSVQEMNEGTNPNEPDTDNDGMEDGWESLNGLNPLIKDANGDPDRDGLINLAEFQNGTRARNPDTDGDTLSDFWEITNGWDPLANALELDSDGDGLTDFEELRYRTDIGSSDTDQDGISDAQEIKNGLDPLFNDSAKDPDSDGLNNKDEIVIGTDPYLADTDLDGMPDGWEQANKMNALYDDSAEDFDFDSISNLSEYLTGENPIDWVDIDEDGMHDLWELNSGLEVGIQDGTVDTDKDRISNLIEFVLGGDPLDSQIVPGLKIMGGLGQPPMLRYELFRPRYYYYQITLDSFSLENGWETLLKFDHTIKGTDLSAVIQDFSVSQGVYRIRMERLP